MTTIVYHDNVIAVDSIAVSEGTIVNTDIDKSMKVDGVLFVFAGSWTERDALIDAYFSRDHALKASVFAIVNDNGAVYLIGGGKDAEYWKETITGESMSIGSGSDHAYTALDLGCNAVEAVKMAIKRDTCTGGRVRTHKVKK